MKRESEMSGAPRRRTVRLGKAWTRLANSKVECGVQPPEQPKKFAVKNGLKKSREVPTTRGRAVAERIC